ncbi:MAG TPA: VOC family protein [Acidimicrobiales bacterium]|nr:VOC family protein [Acidimicrobiales bacterium]
MDESAVPEGSPVPQARTARPATRRGGQRAGFLETLEITIDAPDAEAVARFWMGALGYERLYERPPYVALGPMPLGAAGPRLLIQQVDSVASAKSRVHLDLRMWDPSAEVRRLESLGATVDRVVSEAGTTWTVMADPCGTPFCVCPARAPSS